MAVESVRPTRYSQFMTEALTDETELDLVVLRELKGRPLFALEISQSNGLRDEPVRDALARCLAEGWAVIERRAGRPRLTGAGARELDRAPRYSE